jgi:hypothetical protein
VNDNNVSPTARSEITSVLQEDNAGVTLTYNLARQESALTIGSGGQTIYTEAQIGLRASDRLSYTQRSDGFLSLAQPGPSLGSLPQPLLYTVLVTQDISTNLSPPGRTSAALRRYVTGTATLPQDIPTGGIVDYSTSLFSAKVTPNSFSAPLATNASWRINRTTGNVEATITTTDPSSPATPVNITLTFAGQLNPQTGRLVGSITSPEGYSGRFAGRLYGPAGREFGIAFTTTRGSEQLIGTVVGIQR